MPTGQHEFHGGGIVAGIYRDLFTAQGDEFTAPLQVAGGVLDADDVVQPRQPGDRFIGHVHAGAAGDVVEYLGDVHRFGQCLEVLIKATLGRAVVIGCHQQGGVGTRLRRGPGELYGLAGRIGAGTGYDRQAPIHVIHTAPDDLAVLVHAQGRAFTGGAHRPDGAGARLQVHVQQALEAGPVDAAIGVHGRNQGDDTAGNHG